MTQGYGFFIDRESGKVFGEHDTFTCNHCQRVIRYQKRAEAEQFGGHCTICDKMICDRCIGKGCTPFEEKIREAETRAANRKSYF